MAAFWGDALWVRLQLSSSAAIGRYQIERSYRVNRHSHPPFPSASANMQRLLVCLVWAFALAFLGWGSANSYALPVTDLSITQPFDRLDMNVEYLVAPDSETFSAVAGAAYYRCMAIKRKTNSQPRLSAGGGMGAFSDRQYQPGRAAAIAPD